MPQGTVNLFCTIEEFRIEECHNSAPIAFCDVKRHCFGLSMLVFLLLKFFKEKRLVFHLLRIHTHNILNYPLLKKFNYLIFQYILNVPCLCIRDARAGTFIAI